ncbi:MAG TPA: hypothetical protein VKF35_22180 [Hyphomicrobiaceae bacterium]|nr:hypothetical protein [Hyphomicrobiaceae bacterium]
MSGALIEIPARRGKAVGVGRGRHLKPAAAHRSTLHGDLMVI